MHCKHDATERHHGMIPLSQSRVPTKPMPPIVKAAETIEITLADSDHLAQFLRRLADKLEVQGRVRITIE